MKTVKYTKDVLEVAAKNSTSVSGIMRYVGCPMTGGSRINIVERLKRFNVDMSHFKSGIEHWQEAGKKAARSKKLNPIDILKVSVENMRVNVKFLKRALLEIGREYKCVKCGITSYNGEPITLQVDHCNSNWKDNREENLQFLCPNCHSQKTKTEKRFKHSDEKLKDVCVRLRNKKDILSELGYNPLSWPTQLMNRIKKVCADNNIELFPAKNSRIKSPSPSEINPNWRHAPKMTGRKVNRPSREELIALLESDSYCSIGRKYGVSDNAVRKWRKYYCI